MAPLKEPKLIILELVIGVPRAPQDVFTNEPQLDTINLLNVSGFAVKLPDGWIPQLPSMKNGGLWSDSALSPGRQLIAGEFANVTETMTLTATGATMEQRLYLKSRLWEFARRAKAYHTDWSEQQPVYIKWHALDAPCAQYALIYNIDAAVENDAFDVDTDTVVITIEREPAWRMYVPPGGNPIEWTYFAANMQRGTDYQYDDMSLDSASSLVAADIKNRHEWTYNSGNPVTTPTTKNYIDILAAQVPGDAPALSCVTVQAHVSTSVWMRRLLMWHSSRDMSLIDQDAGTAMASAYIMNAGDMGWTNGAFVVGSTATAVLNTAAIPALQYRQLTGAGPISMTGRSTTGINNAWWRQFQRGRIAVFVRVQLLGTSTPSDGKVKVTVSERSQTTTSTNDIILPEVDIPIITGSTGDYVLVYCGTVTVPFSSKASVGSNGRGIRVRSTDTDLRFTFDFRTTVAGSRTINFLDAILVPYDESMAEMRLDDPSSTLEYETFILDNTGYLARGGSQDIAARTVNSSSSINTPLTTLELRGNAPLLLPRTDQRLHFINTISQSGGLTSKPNTDMTVRLNIVPRCYGVAAL